MVPVDERSGENRRWVLLVAVIGLDRMCDLNAGDRYSDERGGGVNQIGTESRRLGSTL
jgi:hypothetical protein